MTITCKILAGKLDAYLHHRVSLPDLVDWSERAMMEGDFGTRDLERIRHVVAQLGVADVRAFGLTWEDCEGFLESLGYLARVEILPAESESNAAVLRERTAARYDKGKPPR